MRGMIEMPKLRLLDCLRGDDPDEGVDAEVEVPSRPLLVGL